MPHAGVGAVSRQQRVVRSVLNDTSLFNNKNTVGPFSGCQAVRDDDAGASLSDSIGGVEDNGFGGGVEGGGGFVEKHDGRLDKFGARQRDQLALSG